jgi:hypothetical protein
MNLQMYRGGIVMEGKKAMREVEITAKNELM